MRRIDIEAPTLEEAKTRIRQQLPAGAAISSEEIVSEGAAHSVDGTGETVDIAVATLKRRIPESATILTQEILQVPELCTVKIRANSAEEACQKALATASPGKRVYVVDRMQRGRRGLFGIGRTPHVYHVQLATEARVRLTYRENARIRADVAIPDR